MIMCARPAKTTDAARKRKLAGDVEVRYDQNSGAVLVVNAINRLIADRKKAGIISIGGATLITFLAAAEQLQNHSNWLLLSYVGSLTWLWGVFYWHVRLHRDDHP